VRKRKAETESQYLQRLTQAYHNIPIVFMDKPKVDKEKLEQSIKVKTKAKDKLVKK
jgi:hypothetical protein